MESLNNSGGGCGYRERAWKELENLSRFRSVDGDGVVTFSDGEGGEGRVKILEVRDPKSPKHGK